MGSPLVMDNSFFLLSLILVGLLSLFGVLMLPLFSIVFVMLYCRCKCRRFSL